MPKPITARMEVRVFLPDWNFNIERIMRTYECWSITALGPERRNKVMYSVTASFTDLRFLVAQLVGMGIRYSTRWTGE